MMPKTRGMFMIYGLLAPITVPVLIMYLIIQKLYNYVCSIIIKRKWFTNRSISK